MPRLCRQTMSVSAVWCFMLMGLASIEKEDGSLTGPSSCSSLRTLRLLADYLFHAGPFIRDDAQEVGAGGQHAHVNGGAALVDLFGADAFAENVEHGYLADEAVAAGNVAGAGGREG